MSAILCYAEHKDIVTHLLGSTP